jgi:para-aminobenzoate synthetase/4-amino-4-deoxychorismate lyase
MRVEAGTVPDLALHLARLARTAAFLGSKFDRKHLETSIPAMIPSGFSGRLRLLLAPSGATAVQLSPLPAMPDDVVSVALVPLPVREDDWRLRHKTTDRGFYDAARAASGAFDVVFVRPDGQITEGSFTNIFVERDGLLLTPPLSAGLLPGILRQSLLAEGRSREAALTVADLADGFLLGNALRGLLPARLA